MKQSVWAGLSAGVLMLVLSSPAFSHHSHAMFDHSTEVTITGTVSEYAYVNPHAFLYVDVEDEDGDMVKYWIEMSNVPDMTDRGVDADTFRPGDEVIVNMWPLRDGRPGGNYITITAADGKTYD